MTFIYIDKYDGPATPGGNALASHSPDVNTLGTEQFNIQSGAKNDYLSGDGLLYNPPTFTTAQPRLAIAGGTVNQGFHTNGVRGFNGSVIEDYPTLNSFGAGLVFTSYCIADNGTGYGLRILKSDASFSRETGYNNSNGSVDFAAGTYLECYITYGGGGGNFWSDLIPILSNQPWDVGYYVRSNRVDYYINNIKVATSPTGLVEVPIVWDIYLVASVAISEATTEFPPPPPPPPPGGSITFPQDLPIPDRSGYGDSHEDMRSRMEMENGPVRQRRKMRTTARTFTLQWSLSEAQYRIFDLWWQNTIRGGERGFDIQLLDDDETLVWYSVTVMGGLYKKQIQGIYSDDWVISLKVRTIRDSFAERDPGTDQLIGIARISMQNTGSLRVPAVLRGLSTITFEGHGRLVIPPLYGLSTSGVIGHGRLGGTGSTPGTDPETLSRVWGGFSWFNQVSSQDITGDESVRRNWMEI